MERQVVHQIQRQLFLQALRYVNFLMEVTQMVRLIINGMMPARIRHLEYQQDIVDNPQIL